MKAISLKFRYGYSGSFVHNILNESHSGWSNLRQSPHRFHLDHSFKTLLFILSFTVDHFPLSTAAD
jgi:hypothetical protein